MSWRRPWVLALLVFIIAPVSARQDPRGFPRLWMVNGGYYRPIDRHLPKLTPLFLRPPAIIVGPYQLVPGGVYRYEAMSWPSFVTFRHAASYSPRLGSAMYDPEGWSQTLAAEREHPVAYFARFSALARGHGWAVIMAPHPDLTGVSHAACAARSGESEFDAFLRCDLIGAAAVDADVVDIQAQALESDVASYRAFVMAAATQARDANPSVRVVAELSTGRAATSTEMFDAWASVRDVVDGYYLSIGGDGRLSVAFGFLRMLPRDPAVP